MSIIDACYAGGGEMKQTQSAIYTTESEHKITILGVEVLAMQETIRTQQAEIERLKEYEDAVYAHFDVACHSYDASKSVYDNLSMLQSWHCDIALDPKVSKPANELHSEIERLKGQRDRLLGALKDANSRLCPFDEKVKIHLNSGLIAEIEAGK